MNYTQVHNIPPDMIIYKDVLSVGSHGVNALLDTGAVAGSVHLVVELLRVGESQLVSHVRIVSDSHEIIVPGTLKY